MEIRISGIENDSIVDGPGFRLAIFTQGCRHACPGCHNPQTHDFAGGRVVDAAKIVEAMADNPLLDGITLTGGDPVEQSEPCAYLAREAHALGLNVWTYTGYTCEQLLAKSSDDAALMALLQATDVLVDGPFILAQRTLSLRFRGSKNQRLIDMPKTLETGNTVEASI